MTLCTDCDYLVHKNTFFKVREYNVFLYQNIIMHYKYLNIIVKQFTHFCRFFGSVDLRAFSPCPIPSRPADFHLRPAPLEKARPCPSLVCTAKTRGRGWQWNGQWISQMKSDSSTGERDFLKMPKIKELKRIEDGRGQ